MKLNEFYFVGEQWVLVLSDFGFRSLLLLYCVFRCCCFVDVVCSEKFIYYGLHLSFSAINLTLVPLWPLAIFVSIRTPLVLALTAPASCKLVFGLRQQTPQLCFSFRHSISPPSAHSTRRKCWGRISSRSAHKPRLGFCFACRRRTVSLGNQSQRGIRSWDS